MKKIISLLFITIFFVSPSFAKKKEEEEVQKRLSDKEVYQLIQKFGDAFDIIRDEYVEEPSDKKLIDSAIRGMLADLDPHSTYLNEDDFKEVRVQTKGSFGGLGIEVTMKDGLVYVVSPIDDTPAFRAGLKAGDYISHLNRESVFGMSIKEAVDIMRGEPGTDIDLTILRKGEVKPIDVKVTRDIIKIVSVKSDVYDDIGYIRITSFSQETSNLVKKHLKKIRKDSDNKIKAVVLDLRNNPGGLLNQAIEVSDLFLDKGKVLSTKGRNRGSKQIYNATKGDVTSGMPIAVLINQGSASASEIVAGALKDHHRAIVVGTKSFGKGSVQTIKPLSRDTAIKFTTSRYYTPSGVSIQAEGIVPDVEIKQAEIEFNKQNNKIRVEASLRKHLKNDNGDETQIDLEKIGVVEEEEGDKIEKLYKEDYQLARTIDLLKAIYIYKHNLALDSKVK